MSRVLFISPPYENLGIEYLSAHLKGAGHQVSLIIDPCLFSNPYHKSDLLAKLFQCRGDVLNRVKAYEPDLVCFSVMTDTYQWALGLAGKIKRETAAPIVFGGIHPTVSPRSVITNQYIDYICVGEGEEAIVELADRINDADRCLDIANIWAKKHGKIISNPNRPLIHDLDRLHPPDKEIYYQEVSIYGREYFTIAGRGCAQACAFCCNHILLELYGRGFIRRQSPHRLIKELAEAKDRYGFKFVWFMDDNFISDGNWLKAFAREYRDKIKAPFFCYAHPNDFTADTAKLLKDCNCHEVAIGVESLNEDTCRKFSRVTERAKVRKAIEQLRSHKIISVTENILGFPGEEEADIIKLVDFYNENRPDLVLFSWLKVFPGTRMLKWMKSKNLIDDRAQSFIEEGKDRSLAMGGNFAYNRLFNSAACLLALTPFLSRRAVRFMIGTRIFRLFAVLNPNLLLRLIRIYKALTPSSVLTGKSTYDAGVRINMRIYRHFIARRLGLISG